MSVVLIQAVDRILINYQLPVKKVTYKVKHSNKGKNRSLFFLSRRLVFSLSTSLLRSFNSARPSSPIFSLSSYKSQVTTLHTFSLSLSSRFGVLNGGFADLFQVKARVG